MQKISGERVRKVRSKSDVRYVSNLDTSQVSRPCWGRRALLALCVLAVICVTPAQIATGDWLGAAAIVALCTADAVMVLSDCGGRENP